jgi:hypothetical protein
MHGNLLVASDAKLADDVAGRGREGCLASQLLQNGLVGVLISEVKGPKKIMLAPSRTRMALLLVWNSIPTTRSFRSRKQSYAAESKSSILYPEIVCSSPSSKDGKLEPLEGGRDSMGPPRGSFGDGGFGGGGGRTPNPYASPGSTGWVGGRTPNPYVVAGGKTPAWSSSKTPNPYTEGGRTPFNTSSQTPNPYAQEGGRTPGWGSSARTPNPYTAAAAASTATTTTANRSTPGSGWGGATPAWGGATPKPSSSWNDSSSAPSNSGWASPGPPAPGGWGESSWVSPLKLMCIHGSS